MAVSNQKLITTKRPDSYPAGTFIMLPKLEWEAASENLSPTAFLVWMKLASNANNYTDEFSPAYYIKHHGGCERSYQRARKELEEKGYITKQGSRYIFHLEPELELPTYAAATASTQGSIASSLV